MFLSLLCVNSDPIGSFKTLHVVTAQSAPEGGLAKNTGVVESGAAREQELSTDFDIEMDRLGSKLAALRRGLAENGAYRGLEKGDGQ